MDSKNLKEILINQLKNTPKEVAILLSKGIDSNSLLFSLLELNKNIHIYSFTLDDRESSDFKGARDIAKSFKLEFNPIYLPTDIEILKKDVLFLINSLGLRKKTEIECTWAMMYAIKTIKENTIISGLGADGHFCISKKGMLHYKFTIELMNKFRESLFNNHNYAQKQTVTQLAKELGKEIIIPYLSEDMINLFKDMSWEEINKPKQKQVILDCFPEYYEKIKIYNHQNFQLGDSGIAEHFTKLIDTDWHINDGKTVISIYNAVARGEIK